MWYEPLKVIIHNCEFWIGQQKHKIKYQTEYIVNSELNSQNLIDTKPDLPLNDVW